MFTQGRGGADGPTQGSFVGLAMGEAGKLFDAQAAKGRVPAGSEKESAVLQAGEMALKMYLKSRADSGGAGPGGLLGMASKFV